MANEMRPIDANALAEKFWQEECRTQTRRDFVAMVHYAPTVDAVPVVHGWWLPVTDNLFPGTKEKCSLCGIRKGAGYVYRYCPNCGAKMDGGKNDER